MKDKYLEASCFVLSASWQAWHGNQLSETATLGTNYQPQADNKKCVIKPGWTVCRNQTALVTADLGWSMTLHWLTLLLDHESNHTKITSYCSWSQPTCWVQTELLRVNHAGWYQDRESDCQIEPWLDSTSGGAYLAPVSSLRAKCHQYFSVVGVKVSFKRCFGDVGGVELGQHLALMSRSGTWNGWAPQPLQVHPFSKRSNQPGVDQTDSKAMVVLGHKVNSLGSVAGSASLSCSLQQCCRFCIRLEAHQQPRKGKVRLQRDLKHRHAEEKIWKIEMTRFLS